ncbi:hypothetical protein O0L34_g18533 [Tuta absoluta]|nr:hypothetical protein O0L34_g18533 [Tuta absoluta]
MFLQLEGFKRIDYYFPNITSTVLPKFKPISDEQMTRMKEILRDLPKIPKPDSIKPHTTKPYVLKASTRKGRLIEATKFPTASKAEAVREKTKEDRQSEKGCPQGGTCEFFFYCWMVGGLLDGTCGSLLKGCCHRVAKAGILGVQDSNSIEYNGNEGLNYGPVINDESKCHKCKQTG